jgi:mono/diheme cytochrome c family protein
VLLLSPTGQTQTPTPQQNTQAASAAAAATIKQYCVGCHSAALKTGGVVLDPTSLDRVASNAETWERAIKQLRAKSMPPVPMPRPDAATYDRVATYLETELDRAATAKPNPGDLPNLHRLTRTEYHNAIRDLLAIDDLPKEMDYTLLLPSDNASSGFDNIADLLYVSPATMERYLDASTKISRLAVGDPAMPVMVNIYRTPLEGPQDSQVEELAFGTRGGTAIRSYFPLDGEYEINVELAGQARDQHQLEITVDGERKQIVTLGGNAGRGGRGRGAGPAPGATGGGPGPVAAAGGIVPGPGGTVPPGAIAGGAPGGGRGGRGGPSPTDFRIAVKAGPRLIGVTFVQKTQALDEATLHPRQRSRGTQPSIASVTIRGPYNSTGPGDTPSRQRIFVCRPANVAAEPACAKQIVSTLARRAYRRPVTDADVSTLMAFYDNGRKERDFDLGIQRALERLLVSPQFLYRIERDPAGAAVGSAHTVSDLELASRLSFFLWSSIPDDELLNIAASGKLKQPGVLEQQVKRMLADQRSESMVNNFAAQWLYLRDVDLKAPDLFVFRDFDEGLRESFEKETDLFLDSILRENRSVLELLTANYTFVNERLAKHYGIPNIRGAEFQKVTFPKDSPRGGLLGQGGILLLTSYSTRTSPVLRGKYILENLLAAAPPPPPANVPSLKTENAKSGEQISLREAMAQHRTDPACANCHARMDPIGFAMENFDAIGKWRDHDGVNAIDVNSKLPDGTVVDGLAGVKQLLLNDPQRFVGAMTQKLLMYAIGRNVQYFDEPAVRKIVRDSVADNYKFDSLVLGVVKSAPFQMRTVKAEVKLDAKN